MIPGTLLGLAGFLVLLGPGFTYLRRRDRSRSRGETSPLRETLTVVSASLLCDALALLVFAGVRIRYPAKTPDIGELVRTGSAYLKLNYASLTWWAVATYLLAHILAYLAAHPWIRSLASRVGSFKGIAWIVGKPPIQPVSAWTAVVDLDSDSVVVAGCELDDGSWVGGNLFSYNPKPTEDENRALILSAPLQMRPKGDSETKDVPDVGFFVVSASKIVRLDLTHLDPTEGADGTGDPGRGTRGDEARPALEPSVQVEGAANSSTDIVRAPSDRS